MKKQIVKNNYLTKDYFDKELTKRLNRSIKNITEYVDIRFNEVDRRFEQVDRRFEQVDRRFEQIDEKLNKIMNHLDWLVGEYKRFDEEHIVATEQSRRQNDKLENHETRISTLEQRTISS